MATKQKTPTSQLPELLSDTPANSVILTGERGMTSISPDVVAKIAGLAVREVNGVHALVPFGTGQALTSLAKQISGSDHRDLGVRVEVGSVETAVDTRIIADYGASIPDVASQIRDNVETRIREMTGLQVKEVNIQVVDLYFEDDSTPAPVAAPRVR